MGKDRFIAPWRIPKTDQGTSQEEMGGELEQKTWSNTKGGSSPDSSRNENQSKGILILTKGERCLEPKSANAKHAVQGKPVEKERFERDQSIGSADSLHGES